ncbi:hypothetical protein FJ955_02970 [Mesorhizobium sp. B2-2-2]|uniref:hypothetical protein n=1 Tax=Mesorhizobium sp. B2-2-2 TaxID=2589964 RepID=UPI0011269B76|nr:hypothetical protein [Mesorhizobium sp. B2-2-2]TPM33718.1 hypothetical protein FJ955_02970 [Mesorhizobium sp. B2-2-2]
MGVRDPRDNSRTERGKTFSLVKKHTLPPNDQGGWIAETREFLESSAYRTLSMNGRRALDRLKIEHIGHGRTRNGKLIVTHDQFISYDVTPEYVGDALDELAFKGLLKVTRGRAGNGTAHPNVFRLTFDGDSEGAPATNEWRRFTDEDAKRWVETVREQRKLQRAGVGRKSKSSLRSPEARPLRVPEIRIAAGAR